MSESARQRAIRTVEASGLRIADAIRLEEIAARIEAQAAAAAIWIELDLDPGDALDDAIAALNRSVGQCRYAAIVAAPAGLIDQLSAQLSNDIQLLIDAGESERAAALALATANCGSEMWLSDVSADRSAARLRQLSDEVNRIASTLAHLSAGTSTVSPQLVAQETGDVPSVPVETIRAIIRARRLRSRYFRRELFADPAWDMMLDLLHAEAAGLRVTVSSLCIAAAVPATTALRWMKSLVDEGLFVRLADPHDGRRVYVELAPAASRGLRGYFAEIGQAPVV